MKKISIRRIFSLILIVFVIGGVLYINSPRYIIKRTVMKEILQYLYFVKK